MRGTAGSRGSLLQLPAAPNLRAMPPPVRLQVSGLLWDLVQHRCDLVGQLEGVRAYFLLGRGDFYQQFLDEVCVAGPGIGGMPAPPRTCAAGTPPLPPPRAQAQPLLAGEPKPHTAEADIALAFQQSALKSTAEADPHFGAMSLRWMPPDQAALPEDEGGAPVWHPARCTSVSVPRCDSWDGLFLECSVEWPLQLLFPPEVRVQRGSRALPCMLALPC